MHNLYSLVDQKYVKLVKTLYLYCNVFHSILVYKRNKFHFECHMRCFYSWVDRDCYRYSRIRLVCYILNDLIQNLQTYRYVKKQYQFWIQYWYLAYVNYMLNISYVKVLFCQHVHCGQQILIMNGKSYWRQ